MPSGQNSTYSGLVEQVALDSVATFYSGVLEMPKSKTFSIHLSFVGTATSTAVLQRSNIPNADESGETDWVDDTVITLTGASGSAAKELVEVDNAGALKYRIKFVKASGAATDTVDVYLIKKDLY